MSERRPDNVVDFGEAKPVHSQGGGGGGDDRVRELERRVGNLEKDMATVLERTKHMPTKEDLQRLETRLVESQNRQLRWIIGGMLGTLAAALGIILRIFVF